VSAPDALREVLTQAYGQVGRVRKQRIVYVVGRTRVHLDTVETLGTFLELEVVLEAHEAIETGVGEAEALMKRLEIEPSQLVASSYLELLQERDV
jgi:predicted adenylyl cyclase CyaB